jgi:hypothetical protein
LVYINIQYTNGFEGPKEAKAGTKTKKRSRDEEINVITIQKRDIDKRFRTKFRGKNKKFVTTES